MRREILSRRSVLAGTAGMTVAGTTGVVGDSMQSDEGAVSRESFEIREGTAEATTVYVTTADAAGPTAIVVGGVHGNEVAGYEAAGQIADWPIDAGRLVTIPEANAAAIERGTRTDAAGNDLNRQFHEGETPDTKLARAIWDVIREYDPDILIDLHESTGIYAGDPVDGVGQAIFHSGSEAALDEAADAADYVTRNHVDDAGLAFQTGPFSSPQSSPNGLLAHKAARDLGAEAFLAETLSDVALETRVLWQTTIVDRLFQDELLLNASPPQEPVDEVEAADESDDGADGGDETPASDAPTARLQVLPTWTDETALEPGQSITLDASRSRDPDGEIVRYEWRVGENGAFDEADETLEVTIGPNGDGTHPIALRVVDESGRIDIDEVTLSTGC
ncbi:PKD domain-containing protein [Natrinema marinum]|uniref:PKD domain-containing protein n=1 Tax=Natrinema marinum TaxID=2961598 RepID=UPI0020C8F7B7|nr:succinylglutamate desuccinylase/aspartoacylase family protein [Natrinema marinum]